MNNSINMPQATATTTATFTTAQRDQLARYNEITNEFFGLMGSSHVFTELLDLYGYLEESNLIEGVDDEATSSIKRNYLYSIQKIGAFVAELERVNLFFKGK